MMVSSRAIKYLRGMLTISSYASLSSKEGKEQRIAFFPLKEWPFFYSTFWVACTHHSGRLNFQPIGAVVFVFVFSKKLLSFIY